jgi:hypothetical protein
MSNLLHGIRCGNRRKKDFSLRSKMTDLATYLIFSVISNKREIFSLFWLNPRDF